MQSRTGAKPQAGALLRGGVPMERGTWNKAILKEEDRDIFKMQIHFEETSRQLI